MKKVGKQVLMISTTEHNRRNGEGAFIRLKDGRILYAYTKYYGNGGGDHDTANISCFYSADEGETWTDGGVLYEKSDDEMNIMSVSFLRLQNGDLGLVYLQKKQNGKEIDCMPILRRSSDEGVTFGEPIYLVNEPGYYVLVNDRVTMLNNGRIICAIACNRKSNQEGFLPGYIEIYYSDDDGKSFSKSQCDIKSPFNDWFALAEPGIFELPDGRLWLYARTGYGFQYQAFSSDGGETFTSIEPNYKLPSPSSPMQIAKTDKYTFAILNPISYGGIFSNHNAWKTTKLRTPYVLAVDTNGGKSFIDNDFSHPQDKILPNVEDCFYIEDDRNETYCYSSFIEVDGGILIAYYHSNGSGIILNSAKITKILYSELLN